MERLRLRIRIRIRHTDWPQVSLRTENSTTTIVVEFFIDRCHDDFEPAIEFDRAVISIARVEDAQGKAYKWAGVDALLETLRGCMFHPEFNRRAFLQNAAIAASSLALMPRTLKAVGGAANDRINLALIGTGKQAQGLMNGFLRAPGVQVVAVCDVDTTRRTAALKQAQEYYSRQNSGMTPDIACVESYRDVLNRKDVDAVVIATPDHWHALITMEAAKAGKDIYCEKPLCETILESQAMVKAVRDNQRVFQIGSMQRSSPEFRWACEIVRGGRLGKIRSVNAGFGGPGKVCDLPAEEMEPGLNWGMWLGPALNRPYNSVLSPRGVHNHFPAWRNYWEFGGGMVTDWGAHHLDIAQWGLGMDGSGPVEIVPADNPFHAQSGGKLIYANGVEVNHVSDNGVTFFGSDGELYVNRGKFKLTLHGKVLADNTAKPADPQQKPANAGQLAEAAGKELLGTQAPQLQGSNDHKQDFLDALRSRKDPICPVEVGASTVAACHLLNFSYRYGEKMLWDPAAQQFRNGTGKSAWLTRDYSPEWKVV